MAVNNSSDDVPNDRRGLQQPNPDVDPANQTGYEVETVDPAAHSNYECPVCLGILRDPYLNDCCGHHFCKACISQVEMGSGICPLCKKKGFKVFPNLDLKRKVNELRVKCLNHEHGCQWSGELRQLMSTHRIECEFAEKLCPHGCGRSLSKRAMAEHWSDCPNLPVMVLAKKVFEENCELRNLLVEMKQDHKKALEEIDTLKERVQQLQPLAELVQSLREDCDHQKEQTAACTRKQELLDEDQRKTEQTLEKHRTRLQEIMIQVNKDAAAHDDEIAKCQELVSKVQGSSSTLQSTVAQILESSTHLPPLQLVMNEFSGHKSKHDWWHSEPFYSHLCGYKMHLEVKANGNGVGRGTHVSVYVHLMKGENDASLEWPLSADVYFRLLNQQSPGEQDIASKVSFIPGNSAADQVLDGKLAGTGRGYAKFVPHTMLVADHKAYLKDDCLVFEIVKIISTPCH